MSAVKHLTMLAIVAGMVVAWQAVGGDVGEGAEKSYAMGYQEGRHWQRTRAGLDSIAHLQGLEDGLAGRAARVEMTGDVEKVVMEKFDREMMGRAQRGQVEEAAPLIVTGREAEIAGYVIGYRTGEAARKRGMALDRAAYQRGLTDGLGGAAPAIGTNQVEHAIQAVERMFMEKPGEKPAPAETSAPPQAESEREP